MNTVTSQPRHSGRNAHSRLSARYVTRWRSCRAKSIVPKHLQCYQLDFMSWELCCRILMVTSLLHQRKCFEICDHYIHIIIIFTLQVQYLWFLSCLHANIIDYICVSLAGCINRRLVAPYARYSHWSREFYIIEKIQDIWHGWGEGGV